jgi:glutaminyl-tRNA synthetase
MGVLDPVKIVIDNYPVDQNEMLDVPNHPKDESLGIRQVPFSREIYIDRADFREEANRKYKRMVLGGEVRLRYGYVIKANEVETDEHGKITLIRCTYDADTLGVNPEGRKIRGVIHWVAVATALAAEIRVYDPLFTVDFPDASESDYRDLLNNESVIIQQGFVEPSLQSASIEDHFQFEREGYFCIDSVDSTADNLVFNRTVGLRDTWAKIEQKI